MLAIGLTLGLNQQPTYAGLFGGNSQNIGLSSSLTTGLALNYNYVGGGDIAIDGDALLPETGVTGASADLGTGVESDQISLYVVRSGDSLGGIAKMFNVSVNTIVWANDLTRGATLKEGQVLTILPVNGIQHTVVKGETLATIAKKFGGDSKEIAQFNDFALDAKLVAGQVVLVPGGEEPVIASASPVKKPVVRGSNAPAYEGYYIRPMVGGVRTQGLHGFNGVDLANRMGVDIVASAAGQVIVSKNSGWNGGYGNYVVIKHPNGTQTVYGHLLNSLVSVGQSVAQGQLIGHLGSSGNSTGPHIHFEIRGAKNPF